MKIVTVESYIDASVYISLCF